MYEIFKVFAKRSFVSWRQIRKLEISSKLLFVFRPRNLKFKVVLKRRFVFWLQTTKIKLIYFFTELLIILKQTKLSANLSQKIFENTKKEFSFVSLVFRSLTQDAKQLYWNNTSAWMFSCKFAAYFQNTFSWEHLWVDASNFLSTATMNTVICPSFLFIITI